MPSRGSRDDLTGNTRYRKSWFGVSVLQVEIKEFDYIYYPFNDQSNSVVAHRLKWRDATEGDLSYISWMRRNEEHKRSGSITLPPPPPDRTGV